MARGDPIDVVGPYRILRQIGSGGMGSIFEAIEPRLGQHVALKRLHPHVAARPGATMRFLREGRAAARVRHPHVVQVFSLGDEEAGPYLAMELLDGQDLAAVLARQGKLRVTDALTLLLPVLAGVAAAHEAGVIHRDLKPSNIFVARGPGGHPWPKVVDFGVSKVLAPEGANGPTATDGVVGTAAYMAPEQARSAREASFTSDQYSLGVILYQCVTGTLPFMGSSEYELCLASMTAPLIAPSQRIASLTPAFDALVMRAMDRKPGERFPSVRAFGEALLPFAGERDRAAFSAEFGRRGEGSMPGLAFPVATRDGTPETGSPATVEPTVSGSRTNRRAEPVGPRARLAITLLAASLSLAALWLLARPATTAQSPRSAERPAPTAQFESTPEGTELASNPGSGLPDLPADVPSAAPSTSPPKPRRDGPRLAPSARTPDRPASAPPTASSSVEPQPAMGTNGSPIIL
jgi:serine/threonine-protein kinase